MSDLRTRDSDGALSVVARRHNPLRTLGQTLLPGQTWKTNERMKTFNICEQQTMKLDNEKNLNIFSEIYFPLYSVRVNYDIKTTEMFRYPAGHNQEQQCQSHSLTNCSHAPWGQMGLLDAPASPVGSQDGFTVAEGAVSIAAGQFTHRVSNDAVGLQTQRIQKVDQSDLERDQSYI